MYDNFTSQTGPQRPGPPDPFGNPFYGAGSDLIKSGFSAYGEKFFGSNSEFQSNISRYFSNPQYYFNVNEQYVWNKLKVVLLPFLYRGHWTRIAEPVGGVRAFKPPIYDINAPDLYIPFMAFGTFVILSCFSLGFVGKFTPDVLNIQFTRALFGWIFQIILLKIILSSIGSSEVPFLDLASYSGYSFTYLSLALISRVFWGFSYYFVTAWMSLCMGVFLVKTMKRVIFSEMRSYERNSGRQHYLLLFMALVQFPVFFWLGRV
ncbi:hypothetical protein LUZ60_010465 [Juncus effusus]|nr:hypothetical protein LUZ60_010465 [Juncus effusus]